MGAQNLRQDHLASQGSLSARHPSPWHPPPAFRIVSPMNQNTQNLPQGHLAPPGSLVAHHLSTWHPSSALHGGSLTNQNGPENYYAQCLLSVAREVPKKGNGNPAAVPAPAWDGQTPQNSPPPLRDTEINPHVVNLWEQNIVLKLLEATGSQDAGELEQGPKMSPVQ